MLIVRLQNNCTWPVRSRIRFTLILQIERTYPVPKDSMEAMLRRNPAKRAELVNDLMQAGSPSEYWN